VDARTLSAHMTDGKERQTMTDIDTSLLEKTYPSPEHVKSQRDRRLWVDACRVILGNGDYQKAKLGHALAQSHRTPSEEGKEGVAA
jgi:hypothetical protein